MFLLEMGLLVFLVVTINLHKALPISGHELQQFLPAQSSSLLGDLKVRESDSGKSEYSVQCGLQGGTTACDLAGGVDSGCPSATF